MTAAWAWLQARPWGLWAAIIGVAIVGVLALIFGMRRSAEKAGRALERLEQEKRVRDAEKKMDKVPRPTGDDVDDRLRDGSF